MDKNDYFQSLDSKYSEFFIKLGLTTEETKLYLTLVSGGILTTLQLARLTDINRTRVYRLLDHLKELGLVEEIIDEHRKMAKAVGLDRLEILVKEEENKAKLLKNLFPNVANLFTNQKSFTQPGTKVLFYRGRDGIKQQVWNTLRTKGELLGYSYRPLKELIGDYYLKWYEEWTRRKIMMRDIYSDEYLKSRKEGTIDSFARPTKYIQSRYIPSKILPINHQMDIYNDVVAHYNWYEGDVFGVEIYNSKIASFHKQMFEIIWKMTKKSRF